MKKLLLFLSMACLSLNAEEVEVVCPPQPNDPVVIRHLVIPFDTCKFYARTFAGPNLQVSYTGFSNSSVDWDAGYLVGGAVGYKFAPLSTKFLLKCSIRLEGEVSYSENKGDLSYSRYRSEFSNVYTSYSFNERIKSSHLGYFANILLETPIVELLEECEELEDRSGFYVASGLGFGYGTSDIHCSRVPSDDALFYPSRDGFAFQLIDDFGYRWKDVMDFSIGFRWIFWEDNQETLPLLVSLRFFF